MFHPARTSSVVWRFGAAVTALAAYAAHGALTEARAADPALPPLVEAPSPVPMMRGGTPPEIIPLTAASLERPDMTGGYFGLSLGASSHLFDSDEDGAFGALLAPVDPDTQTGFLFGLHAGYDLDLGGVIVGAETDISIGKVDSEIMLSAPAATTASLKTDLVWLGTTRLRAGVALDRLMVYATGGLAYGAADVAASVNTPAGAEWTGFDDQMRVGYAIGAGAEYALTDQLSLRGEYLHYDLGTADVALRPNAAATANGNAYTAQVDLSGHAFRVGATYTFR